MKRILLLLGAVMLIAVLAFGGCAKDTAPAETTTEQTEQSTEPEKTYTLRLHYEVSPQAPLAVYGFDPWAAEVEEITDGRIKFEVYKSDALFNTKTQVIEGVTSGTADIAMMYAWAYTGKFDLIDVLGQPFMAPNAEVSSRVTWEIFQKFPEVQEQWKDVKVLGHWTTGPFFLLTTDKMIETLDDFSGMKMRATGGAQTEMMKLLGASPVGAPMPESYENLQKGVVDGMAANGEAALGFRLYEVASNYTMVGTTLVTQQMIMNKDSWNALPTDLQDLLMSVSGEKAAIRFGGSVFDRALDMLPDRVAEEGFTMNSYTPPQEEIDKWIEVAGKPLWADWVTAMEEQGHSNAAEIQAEALRLVEEYSAGQTDMWRDMY